MTFKIKIIACLMAFNLITYPVFAQKKVETLYFTASWDTAQTKAEASYYRVVQTNGVRRVTIDYDSADVMLAERS